MSPRCLIFNSEEGKRFGCRAHTIRLHHSNPHHMSRVHCRIQSTVCEQGRFDALITEADTGRLPCQKQFPDTLPFFDTNYQQACYTDVANEPHVDNHSTTVSSACTLMTPVPWDGLCFAECYESHCIMWPRGETSVWCLKKTCWAQRFQSLSTCWGPSWRDQWKCSGKEVD